MRTTDNGLIEKRFSNLLLTQHACVILSTPLRTTDRRFSLCLAYKIQGEGSRGVTQPWTKLRSCAPQAWKSSRLLEQVGARHVAKWDSPSSNHSPVARAGPVLCNWIYLTFGTLSAYTCNATMFGPIYVFSSLLLAFNDLSFSLADSRPEPLGCLEACLSNVCMVMWWFDRRAHQSSAGPLSAHSVCFSSVCTNVAGGKPFP